jgi:predicted HD superfamily hydrolase involved in NAD metabolism
MEAEQIESRIAKMMSRQRFSHSIGVREAAAALAQRYGADVQKAALAGLVHDCVKEMDYDEMIKLCAEMGVDLDSVTLAEKKLIHARLGAQYAKCVFGIDDDEIYDAIRYHTTGKANMPILTKILYVADFIEPNRDFDGVEEIREKAFENIDLAILDGLDYTITRMVTSKRMLHPETVNARNYIILNFR